MVRAETRCLTLKQWSTRPALWLALAATLATSACSRPTIPRHPEQRPVTVDLPAEPLTLDFARWRDAHARKICMLVGDTLVAYDAGLQIVPRVAERWETFDSGKRIVFHLRGDVRWHDGVKVTARDVVHTWEVMRDATRASPARAVKFAAIDEVRALDEATVEIRSDQAFAGIVHAWAANPLLPAHRAIDAEHPIGCGAWRFVSWERGRRIVLRANPEHFEPPLVPELRFEVIPDYTTRYNALLSGQTDLSSLHPDLVIKAENDEQFTREFELIPQRFPFVYYVAWRGDGSNPLFVDPRVRRALTLGIDRAAYIEHVAHGSGVLGITLHHPDLPGFDASIPPWPHDPAAAAALLREAGWIDRDRDGVLDNNGKPFRFALSYGSNAESERIAIYLQSELAKLGIACRPEAIENAQLFERLNSREFEAVMLGTWLDPDSDFFDMLHGSQGVSGVNYSGLNDADVDHCLEQARATLDNGARHRWLAQLQARLHQLEPMTVLFYPVSRIAVRRELRGVRNSPLFWDSRPGLAAWQWAPGP